MLNSGVLSLVTGLLVLGLYNVEGQNVHARKNNDTHGVISPQLKPNDGQRFRRDAEDVPFQPKFIIIGQLSSGKSSMALALSGVDPSCHNCQFPVCTEFRRETCTQETSYQTSHWLGLPSNPQVTIVDTPGFGHNQERDEELQVEMMETLNKEVGSANAIVLVVKASDTSFHKGFKTMLKKMEDQFGEKIWNHIIISVSFWTYKQEDIDCRARVDDIFGCETEEQMKQKIRGELLFLDLPDDIEIQVLFIDIMAKINDPQVKLDEHRQSKFDIEAQKLLEFARNHEAFAFKTINDVLQENIRKKREISALEETMNNIVKDIKTNTDAITRLTETTSRFVSYCGYRYYTDNYFTGTLTYERLVTSVNSLSIGGLDTSTGVFTTPTDGTYLITQNFNNYGSGWFYVYINYNGHNLDEGVIVSVSTDNDRDSTGRTLTLQLKTNDKLYLHVTGNAGRIYHITFCITLLH